MKTRRALKQDLKDWKTWAKATARENRRLRETKQASCLQVVCNGEVLASWPVEAGLLRIRVDDEFFEAFAGTLTVDLTDHPRLRDVGASRANTSSSVSRRLGGGRAFLHRRFVLTRQVG